MWNKAEASSTNILHVDTLLTPDRLRTTTKTGVWSQSKPFFLSFYTLLPISFPSSFLCFLLFSSFIFPAFFSYSFLIASYCSVYWHASQFCKIISVIRAIYTIKIKHRHLAINTVSLPNTPYQPHYVSPRVSFGADKNSHNTVPLYVIKFYIGTTL